MEQATDGNLAETDREQVKNEILHHGSGPQCKGELQLERVLRSHDIKDLLLLSLAQRGLLAGNLLILEALNAGSFISIQPLIHS